MSSESVTGTGGQKEVFPATLPAPACGPRAARAGRSRRASTSGHPATGSRPPGTRQGPSPANGMPSAYAALANNAFSFGNDR